MPIYEYQCSACGNHFEEWQKISDAPVKKCPGCGKRKVERIVSLSAFHLKGAGWYVTDYGGKKGGICGGNKDHDAAPKSDAKESATKSTSEKSSAAEKKSE